MALMGFCWLQQALDLQGMGVNLLPPSPGTRRWKMANPQPTDAHLRVAHKINEAVMMRDFSKRQRKILDLILRLSWGCGHKEAYIPLQRDFVVVGVLEVDIKRELDWLEESQVIHRQGPLYWFNKDYEQWQVSRVKPYLPKKLSELLSKNLNGSRPELSELLSKNLVKHEVNTSQNTKSATSKLASPKEILKKDINKEKDIKEKFGQFLNVLLSKEEYEKLVNKFGEVEAKERIEGLSEYLKSKNKRYSNHYATILSWARRDEKEAKNGTHRGNLRAGREIPRRGSYKTPEQHRAAGRY
jgi:hypothetical protein